MDEDRRQEPADADRPDQRPLQHPERPGEHLVGHRPLHDREAADVHDRVREADRHERETATATGVLSRHEHERSAEEDDAQPEVERQPAARREHERDEPADEPARPERGVEVADTGVP